MNFNNFSIPATNLRIFNAQKPLSLYSAPLNTKRISAFQHPCHNAFVAVAFVAGSLLSPNAQAALSCETQPSCSELGYTQNIDATCPANKIIYCPFDKSYKLCALASCGSMGFTTENKSTWCDKIIPCPGDAAYTACVHPLDNPCPTGYDQSIKSVADCGTVGSIGWTYESQTVPTTSGGTAVCGKCMPNSCTGSTDKKSISDCGTSGSKGWNYTSCYYGDEFRGTCTAKTCSSYGYTTSSYGCEIWNTYTSWVGDKQTTCYKCSSCSAGGAASRCINGCTWICRADDRRPSGYPYGTCKNNRSNYECCSYTSTKPSGYASSDIYKC